MKSSSSNSIFPAILVGIIVLIITILIITKQNKKTAPEDPRASALAQCLTEKGVKFYGAFWCPHCVRQKKLFGASADKLPYIECSKPDNTQTEECKNAGIEGYPTWINAQNERLSGELTFEQLAQFSGCTLQ